MTFRNIYLEPDGKCTIGLQPIASVPLLVYDFVSYWWKDEYPPHENKGWCIMHARATYIDTVIADLQLVPDLAIYETTNERGS